MTFNELFTFFLSPYNQLGVAILLLLIALVFSKFSETITIQSGLYIFGIWMVAGFILVFYTESFWWHLLHWFLAFIGFMAVWVSTMFVCEKYGEPYMGDGGMVMLIPIYIFPFTVFMAVVVKGVIYLLT